MPIVVELIELSPSLHSVAHACTLSNSQACEISEERAAPLSAIATPDYCLRIVNHHSRLQYL